MRWKNKNIEDGIYLMAVYLLILLFKGYNYASNDVVDVMSYARYLQDNTLFGKDFYVMHIAAAIPNERYIFSGLLALFVGALEWLPFLLHMIATLMFLWGLYRIFHLYLDSKPLIWLSVLILLGPLYKFNLGGNELFYNMFIASYTAKVFGVWAVYYFLKNKFNYSFILITISTLLHPTVGAQLFIIFVSAGIIGYISGEETKMDSKAFAGILTYVLIAGIYLVLLLMKVNSPGISDSEYFEIFEFRNAHHFFPGYFPLSSYYIEMMLFVSGVYFMIMFRLENLLKLSLIIIFGIFIYMIGAFVFKMPVILSAQWFKSTIWLELFSLIAVMKYFENEFPLVKNAIFDKAFFYILNLFVIVILVLVISKVSYFEQKPYRFVYGMNLSPEEELGLKVKGLTDKDDLFVYPMEFTGFKYYSERSAYVDFKSVVHRRDALGEWYSRIKKVYDVDINTRRSGRNLFKVAKRNYENIPDSKLQEFKNSGIDYLVQYQEVSMDLPVLTKNNDFVVYILK